MNKNLLPSLVLLLLTCMFIACSTERDPCLEPLEIKLTVKFKRALSDTSTATTDTSFTRLIINPINNPNTFTDSGIAGSTASITLSPLSTTCGWYLQPDILHPEKRDTIIFNYTKKERFLSNACGYVDNFVINNISYTKRGLIDNVHNVDSVILNNATVDGTSGKTHITVYFKKP